jgi:hypothetical protein
MPTFRMTYVDRKEGRTTTEIVAARYEDFDGLTAFIDDEECWIATVQTKDIEKIARVDE